MKKLKHLALKVIRGCIFQWQVENMDDEETNTAVELIKYFEILPYHVREEILNRFNLMNFWRYNGIRMEPEAWHVALFLHKDQNKLIMNFTSEDFDLEFLLKLSGNKLRNITELKLPGESILSARVCKQMCHFSSNVQKLDISGCYVQDDAMMYVANLPLVELDLGDGITDVGVRHLCSEDSKARNNLRVLKLGNSHVSLDSYGLILKSMRLIEDMDWFDTRWFSAASPVDLRQQYNIRKLNFAFYVDIPDNEMEIGVATCPKVSNIQIISNIFTPKMLHTLTKFKELSSLTVRVYSISDVTIEDKNQPFDRLCLSSLYFHNLVEFSLCDPKDAWISSGYLFTILEMCPNLEKLRLFHCDGFSNKIAAELAKLMANTKLKYLIIEDCELLGPSGIEDLLKITSLVELRANLYVTEVTKRHFDAHPMQEVAQIYGVVLQLNLYHS